jgi:magnesium transporter
LLDDDVDMAAMHLSDKLAYQAAADGRSSRFDTNDDEPSEFDEERYPKLINSSY